jgi:hypothetical protein
MQKETAQPLYSYFVCLYKRSIAPAVAGYCAATCPDDTYGESAASPLFELVLIVRQTFDNNPPAGLRVVGKCSHDKMLCAGKPHLLCVFSFGARCDGTQTLHRMSFVNGNIIEEDTLCSGWVIQCKAQSP